MLERGCDPSALIALGRARLTRLIARASHRHLGAERAQEWLAAAQEALDLYGDHPAVAFDALAAEVHTEVRLLRALQAELAHHAPAREQACGQADPDQLARSLPGLKTVGGPALVACMGDPARFPSTKTFRSFTGLARRPPRRATRIARAHLGALCVVAAHWPTGLPRHEPGTPLCDL